MYLFYFWLCWVFVTAHGLSLVAASGGHTLMWYTGFALRWLLVWCSTGYMVHDLRAQCPQGGDARVGGDSLSGAGVGFCGASACPWDFTPVSTLRTALGAGPAVILSSKINCPAVCPKPTRGEPTRGASRPSGCMTATVDPQTASPEGRWHLGL